MLPKKWFIKVTPENYNVLYAWYVKNIHLYKGCEPQWTLGINGEFHYPQHRIGIHTTSSSLDLISQGYERISIEDFQEHYLINDLLIFN